jgi:ATP-dependent metalloprotease
MLGPAVATRAYASLSLRLRSSSGMTRLSPLKLLLQQQQQQQRGFLSGAISLVSSRRLKGLESAASKSPKDPQAQAAFMAELAKSHPAAVVRWVESGKYAVNESVARSYVGSLASLGRLDRLNTKQLVAPLASMAESGGGGGMGAAAPLLSAAPAAARGGTPNDPIFVSMYEHGWKQQAWRTLRSVLFGFMVISAVGALMEGGGGISGRLGMPGNTVQLAESSDKRFADVVGIDEAKDELEEIVMYLRDPAKFTRLGGELPKGLLLMGPPGTGKTLLAKAVAGEAGVPFFYTSGSEFEEVFVGVGAKRVRDLFKEAKARAPCIIFIDEIDAIGGSRQLREQQNMKMTLNQLLVEMDGFEQNSGVIVVAATNFPEGLDKALVRPGRFDKHVAVPLPDVRGRNQILELYAGKTKLAADVDLKTLARGTPGMSGADLHNLINQAALKASQDGHDSISTRVLEWAKDKILMGAERRSAVISEETKRMTAYHEGGHALVALKTPGADPVHKATVMPRGQALGMVMQLPEGDQTSMTRQQMLAKLDVCMGGRVAEELIFGEDQVTSGASSDIQQVSPPGGAIPIRLGCSLTPSPPPFRLPASQRLW